MPSCTSLISSSTQLVVIVIVVKLYHIHTGGDFVSRSQVIQGRYTSLLFQASLFTHTFPDLPYPPLINTSPNRFLPSLPLSLSFPLSSIVLFTLLHLLLDIANHLGRSYSQCHEVSGLQRADLGCNPNLRCNLKRRLMLMLTLVHLLIATPVLSRSCPSRCVILSYCSMSHAE